MKQKRPIRIDGEFAFVPLTQGLEAVIDASDLHLVEGHNWYAAKMRHTVYAARGERRSGVYRTVLMHRLICAATDDVDHRDGNGLNNKRANLRSATTAQNQFNQRKAQSNSSGYKGVSYCSARGLWQATICLNGKNKFLGRFVSQEQAAEAYRKASELHYGEFARSA